jgi:hypothetical protein
VSKDAKKIVLAPRELGEYEFQCEGCKTVHQRSMWSVAHYNVPHTYTCSCGHVTEIVS